MAGNSLKRDYLLLVVCWVEACITLCAEIMVFVVVKHFVIVINIRVIISLPLCEWSPSTSSFKTFKAEFITRFLSSDSVSLITFFIPCPFFFLILLLNAAHWRILVNHYLTVYILANNSIFTEYG